MKFIRNVMNETKLRKLIKLNFYFLIFEIRKNMPSRIYYYALSDKFTRYSRIDLTFKSMLPYILFVFFILVPIIEIAITDINQKELDCNPSLGLNIVEWSYSKNIFIMMLSMLMVTYLLFSKHSVMRYFLRISIFIANFFILIWLIVGIVLIYSECLYYISDTMSFFNFFNILFGMITVLLSLYIVYDSFSVEEIPLLDASHV
jgi:hypothetical protein